MNRLSAVLTLLFASTVIGFGTWSLYKGNLEAAYSTFPFLLIIYVFVKYKR